MLLAVLPSPAICQSESGGAVFWRYSRDRYNRPAMTDPVPVPPGADPYEYLAGLQGYDNWHIRNGETATVMSEKAADGVVPILCLHKISREEDYALTPERFRDLLKYINRNDWYLVSDFQYLQGDFSRVPNGMKPIVMGSDDASWGNMTYQTRGDTLTGEVRRRFGEPVLDRNSMVAILERHAKKEDGRINFTFYISFDGVPFRQLDGEENPGFPYRDIPLIYEKVSYLDDRFILGIHSLSHTYAPEMGAEAFARDVMDAWELIDEYAGGTADSIRTMAFPYGIHPLTPDIRRQITALERNGVRLAGAFDFNNRLAPPPGKPGDSFEVSRINVDNRHWDELLETLESADAVVASRCFVWETESKRLPRSRYALGADAEDEIWILVRGG